MRETLIFYLQLMRFHRPIGTLLLLWPTLWAVWLGGQGKPSLKVIIIFVLGTIIMRAAGCIINDIADRHFDKHVTRTKTRPITIGAISVKSALCLFTLLCLTASSLLLFLNLKCFFIALIALALCILYPFIKRISHLPQLILGLCWNMGILMAFAAQQESIPYVGWLLYLTAILWTIAFDTEYAMADRADDLKIGIKSTAILFGNYDRLVTGVLQLAVTGLLISIGALSKMSPIYYIFLLGALLTFIYQHILIANRNPAQCIKAFLNNNWFGLLIFLGIFLSFLLHPHQPLY